MTFLREILSGDTGRGSITRSGLAVVGLIGLWLLLLETVNVAITGKWLSIENEALWITIVTALSAGYPVMRMAKKGQPDEVRPD